MSYVYTSFNQFVNEQRTKKEEQKFHRVKELLAINRERGSSYDVPDSYNVWYRNAKLTKAECKQPNLCYLNALDTAKNSSLDLVIGLIVDDEVLEKSMIDVTPHAWNTDDKGRIYDYTLARREQGEIYIGRRVSQAELQTLDDGSDVRDLLKSEIDRIQI